MTPTPPAIEPATEQEIDQWLCGPPHGCEDAPDCDWCKLIARIRAQQEEIAKLQAIIMGTTTESRVTLGVNIRRYWSAEDQSMLGRMLFDEDLRTELATSQAKIAQLESQLHRALGFVEDKEAKG
jgi:hypothetical protein